MAKKKKPAVNPARGFATTSIASKLKVEKTPQNEPLPLKDEVVVQSEAAPTAPSDTQTTTTNFDDERESHDLSPEELEQRLERAELQGLVEKYAAKSNKDSSRHVARLTADYRILRGHAHPLQTRGLLSDELMAKVLDLAADDVRAGRLVSVDEKAPRKPILQEEDLTVKVWTLQRSLLELGFLEAQVDDALRFVLEFPPGVDNNAPVWGLEETLDWLALCVGEEELPQFDSQAGRLQNNNKRRITVETPSGTQTPDTTSSTPRPEPSEAVTPNDGSTTPQTVSGADETPVSDLESDLEPEELLSIYLSTKLQLHELQPTLVEGDARRSNKKLALGGGATKPISRKGKGLQKKLQKIESDMLFDKDEADRHWIVKRNQAAQETAERRRLQLPAQAQKQAPAPKAKAVIHSTSSSDTEESDESQDEDTAFSDLFGAMQGDFSGTADRTSSEHVEPGANLSIRDFGQLQGLTPWRVLEEACRARDSRSTLKFTLVSLSAFANRHSLTITWSKDHDLLYPLQSDAVLSVQSYSSSTFTMVSIATPDAQQSKAYISTFALFQIFSTSLKEEKVYLRLSTAWKDLWAEFTERRKLELEEADRENLRKLRDIVRQKMESEDNLDDIVLTRNFQKRINDNSGRSSSRNSDKDAGMVPSLDEQQVKASWMAKSSSPSYKRMLQGRMKLPMFLFKDAALSTVEQNQVVILCGETGCGKSTQMPAYILEREMSLGKPCKIYCTEPRRISAITLAQRVSEELGENKHDVGTLRSLIGYAIRLESHISSSTRLVYATTGIVLRMLESADGFEEVTHIVIDEVHERSIETDFLLIILRSLLVKRPELKVILMSATVDAQRFSNYFHGAPVLTVPGRTFPVETKFLEDAIEQTGYSLDEGGNETKDGDDDDVEDQSLSGTNKATNVAHLQAYSVKTRNTLASFNEYTIEYALIVKLIHMIAFDTRYTKYSQAILVFLPGLAEIRRLNDMLQGTKTFQGFLIHSLHSTIASEDQQAAFALPPRGMRKIVISTNIAETGVTIPDITCVIDTGKHKEMRFDERRQISRLIESFVSRANAKQRRGRAGRVQEGLCFHLFTKSRHDEVMADQQTPEMLRLSLQDLVMRVKICKLGDIQSTLADALDAPSAKNIRRAIDALVDVGALTPAEDLTPLGQQLAKLPLDPYLGKLVLYGTMFGCLDVSLTLAATLTSKSPFVSPIGARSQADNARHSFKKGDSDLLTEFNAYSAWRRVCTNIAAASSSVTEVQFCRKSLLSPQTLGNIEDLKAQLLGSLADAGLVSLLPTERSALSRIQNSTSHRARRFVAIPPSLNAHASNTELVSSVIAWSFYPKILARDGKGWRNVATNQSISLHPTSIARGSPTVATVKYLSFYSILQSGGTKNYNANSLTPTHPLPLLLLAGDATFHPIAHVVSIDGARLRFALDGWKTAVAVKYLRRRLEEVVEKGWRGGSGGGKGGVGGMGGVGGVGGGGAGSVASVNGSGVGASSASLGKRLERWMKIWEEIVEGWAVKEAVAVGAV